MQRYVDDPAQWTPRAPLPFVELSLDDLLGDVFLVALPRQDRRALSRLSDRTDMYEEDLLSEIIHGALEKVRP